MNYYLWKSLWVVLCKNTNSQILIPKHYTHHLLQNWALLSPNITKAIVKTTSNQLYFKTKNLSGIWQGEKMLPNICCVSPVSGGTLQLTVAWPKIISKGLSRCVKLTKALGEAENCLFSFLYLVLFQSLFFLMKVLLFLSTLKKNVVTHWNRMPFLYGYCVHHRKWF